MTLPVSGAISFNNINVELGVAGTTQASLGQSSYRTLAGVASGAISMSNFYGKSNRVSISYTFSANTANASLNLSSLGGYTAGTTDFTVTVGSGIYLYSTSTGGYGLSLSGATTGDTVTIVNNGFIMGQGGTGGQSNGTGAATAGGPALNIASIGVSSCTINNTNASAYIGGGGGGGGLSGDGGGGGGAGGGAGGKEGNSAAGGSGGGIGSSGSNGSTFEAFCGCSGTYVYMGAGGGGGRIFPGTGGAGGNSGSSTGVQGKGGGSGGGGGGFYGGALQAGGSGGSANASGSNGSNNYGGGGGGGWGASGGEGGPTSGIFIRFGAAGGKAVNLGGKSVTWTSGNTTRVYGAVS